MALPSAQKITLVVLSVTSPNCGGKSISSWFFFQGGFLVCLSFLNLFLCGLQKFPPRQKNQMLDVYTFFGAPPELLGLICTWIFVKSVTKITCHNTSEEKDRNSARCQVVKTVKLRAISG